MRRFIVCIVMCAVLARPSSAAAETIELKSGKEIVGTIVKQTDKAVIVSRQGGAFVCSIARDSIKAIRASTKAELEAQKALEAKKVEAGPALKTDRQKRLREYRLERYEREVLAAKKARGRIKIKFSKNRFGVVDVLLNDKATVSLLVDTGASLVVISRAAARRLGIENLDELPTIHAVLADGSITTERAVTFDSVEVGSQKVKNVKGAIARDTVGSGIDGLLGMSFLRYFHVKMDAKENCLVLEKY